MKCPIDAVDLVMTERQGVEIDYCPTCRGVWLDRGELDKILDRAADAAPAVVSDVPVAPVKEPRFVDGPRGHDGDRGYGREEAYRAPEQYRGEGDRDGYRGDRDRDRDGRGGDQYRGDQPYPYKKKKKESWLSDIMDF